MKSQPVEFLEAVAVDLRLAQDFYTSWKTDGASFFHTRFLDTIRWIEWNPEQFPRKYRDFRRAIIPRTYYAIFFVVEPEVSTVVAILDLRQMPHRLRQQLSER